MIAVRPFIGRRRQQEADPVGPRGPQVSLITAKICALFRMYTCLQRSTFVVHVLHSPFLSCVCERGSHRSEVMDAPVAMMGQGRQGIQMFRSRIGGDG